MSEEDEALCCPHCGSELMPFDMPVETGWDQGFHCACFNDDCSYYKEGWEHMQERYGVGVSYRYRVNPETGQASPLAVWSADAMRDRIL